MSIDQPMRLRLLSHLNVKALFPFLVVRCCCECSNHCHYRPKGRLPSIVTFWILRFLDLSLELTKYGYSYQLSAEPAGFPYGSQKWTPITFVGVPITLEL